mmetsp:Transcript_13990/g.34586  ORF Transcript_13990/g.34586 Transcript_13990/m.34586 type:complete len:1201 (+) Transcript_13990:152-3754(+)|eukprot:CAMPEP_0178995714 /NCGR_PEP_ID=MMETSP0795-20121207/7966_1 /TAXON_ID=88552 /ORGANISM="Amoebophrya sp., Strain Ameob2" /LENGTH=1200 /DNA_ID=CAMNT_0020688023 /DNA_START=78 /DNA_END=3680 /DNA_ORIENTATION=+
MSSRYLELHPGGVLDIAVMTGLSSAIGMGYIPFCDPYVKFVQLGFAVAGGHLTGQYLDFRWRMQRRALFQQVSCRTELKLKSSVKVRDAVAYLYGALAFVLQQQAAALGRASGRRSKKDKTSARELQKQFQFLSELCVGVETNDGNSSAIVPHQRKNKQSTTGGAATSSTMEPFPRALSSPQHVVAACIFLFAKLWQPMFAGADAAGPDAEAGAGSETDARHYLRETIRALARDRVWRRDELWERNVVVRELLLVFLAVLDAALGDVGSSGSTLGNGYAWARSVGARFEAWRDRTIVRPWSAFVAASDESRIENEALENYVPRLGLCGSQERAERCFAAVKELLALHREKLWKAPEAWEEYDQSDKMRGTGSATGFRPGEHDDSDEASGASHVLVARVLSRAQNQEKNEETEATGTSTIMLRDLQSLTAYWRQADTAPTDSLLRKVWATPLPDASMVVRNWSPCSVGARIYRLGESPLDRRRDQSGSYSSIAFEGMPDVIKALYDAAPLAQTRIRPRSEWIVRPPVREEVVAGAPAGEGATTSTASRTGGGGGSGSSSSLWDPLKIAPMDYEFELVLFSMDGVILDEYILSRGETYDFDVERPPRPPQTVEQYRPKPSALDDTYRQHVLAKKIPTAEADSKPPDYDKMNLLYLQDDRSSHGILASESDHLPVPIAGKENIALGTSATSMSGNEVYLGYGAAGATSSAGSKEQASSSSEAGVGAATSPSDANAQILGGVSSSSSSSDAAGVDPGRSQPGRQAFLFYPHGVDLDAEAEDGRAGGGDDAQLKVGFQNPFSQHFYADAIQRNGQDDHEAPSNPDFHRIRTNLEVEDADSAVEVEDSSIALRLPHVKRRWRRLPTQVLLETFPNFPEYTMCPKCLRRMEPCFGVRNLEGGNGSASAGNTKTNKKTRSKKGAHYSCGVDCDGCPRKRLDVNPALLDHNGSFCRTEEVSEPPSGVTAAALAALDAVSGLTALVAKYSGYGDEDSAREGAAAGGVEGQAAVALPKNNRKPNAKNTTSEFPVPEKWSKYDTSEEYSFSQDGRKEADGGPPDRTDDVLCTTADQSVFYLRSDILETSDAADLFERSIIIGHDDREADEESAEVWHRSSMSEEAQDGQQPYVDFARSKRLAARLVPGAEWVRRKLLARSRKLEKEVLLPETEEEENTQPYFHCARCNYDLCKPCAIQSLQNVWWNDEGSRQ